jgi:hypothetical protein
LLMGWTRSKMADAAPQLVFWKNPEAKKAKRC